MKVFRIPVRADGIILFLIADEVLVSTVLQLPTVFFEIFVLLMPLEIVLCDEDVLGFD